MEAIYLLGGFLCLLALCALINWLHSRWAWRQAAREASAMLGQRPPRPSPRIPVPPMADTLYGCDEHYYDGCPNCGRGKRAHRAAGTQAPRWSPHDKFWTEQSSDGVDLPDGEQR